MSVPTLETCRKRKRKPEVHKLQEDFPVNRNGAFRENIRVFLKESAKIKDYSIRGMPIWRTLISHESKNSVIPLYTIKEEVARSSEPYCDHCRYAGWGNHFVSKRNYHFIIPIDTEWNMPLQENVFDLQTHLLHGLIHTNGFGHLICVEGGSNGREFVDIWDRICTNLGARMMTVVDLSKKRSLDLRLLYGVAYGHSWYRRWGYKFSRGSYGVTKTDYENSIELLSFLDLGQIEDDFTEHKQFKEIKQIFRYYRELSEEYLTTFRDLLRFMLIIESHAPQQSKRPRSPDVPHHNMSKRGLLLKKSDAVENDNPLKYESYSVVAANSGTKWPVRSMEHAAKVIVGLLKEMKSVGQNSMTRQDVRDAARLHIGNTGLLDHVIKSLNNVVVGDVLVRRFIDPLTRILHYTVQELGDAAKPVEPNTESVLEVSPLREVTESKPGADVHEDLRFLYTNVLLNYPASESVRSAAQAIRDSKLFVKEWPLWDNDDNIFCFVCRISPSLIGLRSETRELPPGEIVTVPLQATVFDLKQAIKKSFKDTYCIFKNFAVNEINELKEEDMEDDDRKLLFGRVDSCTALTVRGFGIDLESKLKCQGGGDTRTIRCVCGARSDDGERMVACDVCEVWQHTRCCGIEDSDPLSPLFVCDTCCQEYVYVGQHREVLQPNYEDSNPDHMLLVGASDDCDCFGDVRCVGMNVPSENYLGQYISSL